MYVPRLARPRRARKLTCRWLNEAVGAGVVPGAGAGAGAGVVAGGVTGVTLPTGLASETRRFGEPAASLTMPGVALDVMAFVTFAFV